MKFPIFLISIFIQIPLSLCCSTTDQIKFLQCKGDIQKIQDTLKLFVPYSEKPVPQTVFRQISKLCKSALTCVEQIECVEAKRGVAMMNSACEGIEMSSGPFGDCMAKIESSPPDSTKFPCVELFGKDALDSKIKRCKMFTDDVECVSKLASDYCGAPAADAFKNGIPFMKNVLKC